MIEKKSGDSKKVFEKSCCRVGFCCSSDIANNLIFTV